MRLVKLDVKKKTSATRELVEALKRQRKLVVLVQPPVFMVTAEHAMHLEKLIVECKKAVKLTVVDTPNEPTGDMMADVEASRAAFKRREATLASDEVRRNAPADDLDSWMLIWATRE